MSQMKHKRRPFSPHHLWSHFSKSVCLFILFWSLFHRESGSDCCLVCRGTYNIPSSLQMPRCSPIGTWNGQLKPRNCLFHQLPLLRDQLGERSRLEIQKVTSQRVYLNAYEVVHFLQQGFFSLLLSPLSKSNLSKVAVCAQPQTAKFTQKITSTNSTMFTCILKFHTRAHWLCWRRGMVTLPYLRYHSKNLHTNKWKWVQVCIWNVIIIRLMFYWHKDGYVLNRPYYELTGRWSYTHWTVYSTHSSLLHTHTPLPHIIPLQWSQLYYLNQRSIYLSN